MQANQPKGSGKGSISNNNSQEEEKTDLPSLGGIVGQQLVKEEKPQPVVPKLNERVKLTGKGQEITGSYVKQIKDTHYIKNDATTTLFHFKDGDYKIELI